MEMLQSFTPSVSEDTLLSQRVFIILKASLVRQETQGSKEDHTCVLVSGPFALLLLFACSVFLLFSINTKRKHGERSKKGRGNT